MGGSCMAKNLRFAVLATSRQIGNYPRRKPFQLWGSAKTDIQKRVAARTLRLEARFLRVSLAGALVKNELYNRPKSGFDKNSRNTYQNAMYRASSIQQIISDPI